MALDPVAPSDRRVYVLALVKYLAVFVPGVHVPRARFTRAPTATARRETLAACRAATRHPTVDERCTVFAVTYTRVRALVFTFFLRDETNNDET